MSIQGKTYEDFLAVMRQTYRECSGFDVDDASDIGIRLKVLAHQLHGISEQLQELERQTFVQSSTGIYLERHAETRGIVRKNALPSSGVLRFYRESPAQHDIAIAKGVLCATRPDPQLQFQTLQAAVLPAGETSVEVPAVAVDDGAIANVTSGAVCLMVTPAPGISGVQNPQAFSGGVDQETDTALRDRLLKSFSHISNGANCAFYYDLAMKYEGVASAKVLPRQRGRGTVDVVIACYNPALEGEIAERIQQEMQSSKEINVDVLVRCAARDVTDVEAEISIPDGYDPDVVLQECERQVAAYIAGLEVGEALLLAKLGGVLLEVDGVYNYRMLCPAGDLLPDHGHVVVPGDVSVKRMAVG